MANNRLTWDNVAAPNFSGVADNYRAFSQLLGNAMQSGEGMLNVFRDANAHAADQQILARMAGVTDPSQFNAASIIGNNAGAASLDTLKAVGNRTGTLLDWQAKSQDNDMFKYKGDRMIEGNRILDMNQDKINMARSLSVAGRVNEANALLGSIPGLRTDQYNDILGNIDNYGTRSLARDVVSQNLTEDRWNFGRTQRDAAHGDAATQIAMDVLRRAPTTADARAVLEGMDMPAEVRSRAMGALSQLGYGNVYAPLGSGTGAGGGTATPGPSGFSLGTPQRAVASTLSTTFSPAVTAGFLGNFHMEGGYNGAQGDGGSAGGIAQWRGERRENFKAQIGKDPTEATPEEQMRFVQWEMENPGKAGMTVAQRDAILNAKDAGEAARLIDQYYERSSGQHRTQRIAAAQDAYGALTASSPAEQSFASDLIVSNLREAVGQNNATGLASRRDQLINDDSLPEEVVRSLTKEGGAFAGVNQGYLLREINDVINRSGGRIGAVEAATILRRSLDDAGGNIRGAARTIGNVFGLFNNFQPALPGNRQIQDGMVDSMIRESVSGGTRLRADMNRVSEETERAVVQATNAYNQAVAQLQAVQADGRTENLAVYQQRVMEAKAAMDIARAAAGDASLQPDFDRPQPVATSGGKTVIPEQGPIVRDYGWMQVRRSPPRE